MNLKPIISNCKYPISKIDIQQNTTNIDFTNTQVLTKENVYLPRKKINGNKKYPNDFNNETFKLPRNLRYSVLRQN